MPCSLPLRAVKFMYHRNALKHCLLITRKGCVHIYNALIGCFQDVLYVHMFHNALNSCFPLLKCFEILLCSFIMIWNAPFVMHNALIGYFPILECSEMLFYLFNTHKNGVV
jgi:hypothetical protein